MSQLNTFPNQPLAAAPLILAGPVLRRTEAEAVSVWVALRRPCQVQLTVYGLDGSGQGLEAPLLVGEAHTWAVGQQLHLIAVTARPTLAALVCDRIYAYDLHFVLDTGSPLSLSQALGALTANPLSYFHHGLPTFVLPPRDWHHLRLVHGSCRKPHAHGSDALPILDQLLAQTASDPRRRPQQLFFTGDQIYSDDVAKPFLWLASHLGRELLGWAEQLPGGHDAADFPPGQRTTIATQRGGFTAGMGHQEKKINSHLLSLGEFLASYLLYLSPSCWPQSWSQALPTPPPGWRRAIRRLERFASVLPHVRRALANIPVYAIFDDHDVSDDWNLNQAWCLRVLGRPLGRRVVQNALLAYSLVQGWGNTPDQFQPGQPGDQLLQATTRWSAAQGRDADAWSAIGRHLGLPETNPITYLPEFRRDSGHWVLDRPPEALTWHFSVGGPSYQILALDSRTRRGFPIDDSPLAPPQLLSATALQQQLGQFLQAPPAQAPSPDIPQPLTLIIAPTNLFSLKLLDWIQRFHLRHNKVFSTDVGDAWNLPTDSLAQFLTTLFRHRQRAVVLSGDIHFSFGGRLTLESGDPEVQSGVLVQLTSSAIANEEPLTRLLHTPLKHWLLPERPRHWLGQTQPARLQEVSDPTRPTPNFQPSWRCTLHWLPRQAAQPTQFSPAPWLPSSIPKRPGLKFWRSRWLQEGREMVGLNNLAVVQFKGDTVQQDCYWYAPWAPRTVVRSRFESHLTAPPSAPSTGHNSRSSDQPLLSR